MKSKLETLASGVGMLLGIGILFLLFTFFKETMPQIVKLKTTVENYPILSPTAFILGYGLLTAVPFPGTRFISVGAGILFGLVPAFVVVYLGSLIGATLGFWLVRRFGHDQANKLLRPQYPWIFNEMDKHGPLYLAALRLNPVMAFAFINIVGAISGVSYRIFILITACVGMLYAGLYAYIGSKLGESAMTGQPFPIPIFVTLIGLSLIPIAWRFIPKKV